MSVSKSKMEANHKYDDKAYFRTTIRIKRQYEDDLRKYAGGSINGFIAQAVIEKIEREKISDTLK